MKKLLQINVTANIGSTGRIAEEIGQLAMSEGWESYVAYGRGNYNSQSKLIKVGNKFDLMLHGVKSLVFDSHGLGSKHATKKLINKIKKISPDIIHLHNIHGYYINIEVLFKYLAEANIPIVWTLHDCWTFTGHCSHFSYIKCDKWKTLCNKCPQENMYPKCIGFDQSKRNYNLKKDLFNLPSNITLVPVSIWLSEFLKDSLFCKYPVNTIHNGINTNKFRLLDDQDIENKKKEYKIADKFVILGVANNWSQRKGLPEFLTLSKKIKENDIIILIGLNKNQIKTLPPNIIGITHTKSIEELALFYSISDLYINPTWEDNFPTTNLEALSCGIPVATYKTGGAVEQITPETGFIIEQGDIGGLINSINTIGEKGKATYSLACRERALSHFRKEDRYAEYIQLYDNLLNKKQNNAKL